MNKIPDVQAKEILHQLHVDLLKHHPDWAHPARRRDMNQFMARLTLGFFAGHLPLFTESGKAAGWLSGPAESPRLSGHALNLVSQAAQLDWRQISPTIFGAVILSVADEQERAALGMHYTSAPHILKVLAPLFLDGLRADLETAGHDETRLLALRRRLARLRVFDPACGAGNFLVVAYQALRALEAEIDKRLDRCGERSGIPLANFYGIELLEFPAGIARLALRIAACQCDLAHGCLQPGTDSFDRHDDAAPRITCGNALRLDWLETCPPPGMAPHGNEADRGEIYICGNPPFTGTRKQTDAQKSDLQAALSEFTNHWKNAEYAGAWLVKAALYNRHFPAPFAFVATNSLCQGQQVPVIWAVLTELGCHIRFAYPSFLWASVDGNRVGVTVIIVGLDTSSSGQRFLYANGQRRAVNYINPYLTEHQVHFVAPARRPLFVDVSMDYGVYYSKSAGLLLKPAEKDDLLRQGFPPRLIRKFLGSIEFINGTERYGLWLDDASLPLALEFPVVRERIESVRRDRLASRDFWVNRLARRPHQFREFKGDEARKIFVPIVSSVNREYLPVGLADESIVPTNKAFYMPHAPLWCLAVLASRLHLIWISAVCGHLRSDYSYSNTLGWNTFPLPALTEKDKALLSDSAQDILSAREAHFPATLADLYEAGKMPAELRRAHERNDEILEQIYLGRRFLDDGERLKTLFELYSHRMAGLQISSNHVLPARTNTPVDKISGATSTEMEQLLVEMPRGQAMGK
jgi:hypothetical protein